MVRAAAIGIPVWLVLLLALGWAGAGPLAGFVVASLFSCVVVLVLERLVFGRLGHVGWNDRVVQVGAILTLVLPVVAVTVFALIPASSGGIVWGAMLAMVVLGFVVAVWSFKPSNDRD